MIKICNVSKEYNQKQILKNITTTIPNGLHFIVGPTGSGKTTLLKIISGMETEYEGDVYYNEVSIKKMTTKEKGALYNNIVGFIWQGFNLLDDLTVLENVMITTYLKDKSNKQEAIKIIASLKLTNLIHKKVKHLSGGQKQRVAIARELLKNPDIIIADEPTSALDKTTAKAIMSILRKIAKTKTVIIVTHDCSFINSSDSVFTLGKGELLSNELHKTGSNPLPIKLDLKSKLSIKHLFLLATTNLTSKISRFLISSFCLLFAAILIFTTSNNAINKETQNQFDKLYQRYGPGLTDIDIYSHFTNTSGGEENNSSNTDVSQDTSKLYDKYVQDPRVDFVLFSQSFNQISITVNNKTYAINASSSTPTINRLLSGRLPNGEGNEVIVPEQFVKQLGLTNQEVLNTKIDFQAISYNWDSGHPTDKKVSITATITGVIDTSYVSDFQGKSLTYTVDDSFFFSKSAFFNLRDQSEIKEGQQNIIIRAKSPEDMISIKQELNKEGIIPIGRFELIADIVKLNEQTSVQSTFSSLTLAVLSITILITVFFITSYLRKREYAIYRVSGYVNKHLHVLNMWETFGYCALAIILLWLGSPLIERILTSTFNIPFTGTKMLTFCTIIIMGCSCISFIITAINYMCVNIKKQLKRGEQG